MLRLITLGGLSVRNGTVVNGLANPRSRLAILAVLAVAGDRGVRREKLAAMFWPESDEEKARNALRQALFTLKRDLGAGDFTLGTADLRLNPDVLTADVTEFDVALRADRFEDAATLYRGPFLDGVFLRESPEFERWADEQRIRLSREYDRALEKSASAALARGDLRSAVTWWERRSVHDPLSGRVARHYMEALAAAGDRERAIQHAAVHAQLVRQDLEAEPDAEVLRLAERLREAPETQLIRAETAVVDRSQSQQASGNGPDQPGSESAVGITRRVTPGRWIAQSTRASLAIAVIVALVIAGRGVLGNGSSQARLAAARTLPSGRVAVANFENPTGDVELEHLGGLAAQSVIHRLQDVVTADLAGPLSERFVDSTGRAPGSGPTLLSQARALEAGLLVRGTISRSGSSVVIRTELVDVRTAGVVADVDTVSLAPSNIEAGLADLRDRVALAVSLTIEADRVPFRSGTAPPSNVEALREYLQGLAQGQLGGGARPYPVAHFLAAARLDTTFTAPLIAAATELSTLGRYAREDQRAEWIRLRDSVLQVLKQREKRLTRLDREGLAFFDALTRGDIIGMRNAAESAAKLSPGSEWSCQAARIATAERRLRRAVLLMTQVDLERAWARSNFNCWKYLLDPLHLLDEYASEERAAAQYLRSNPRLPSANGRYIRALISAGRFDEALGLAHDLLNGPGDIMESAKQIAEEFQAHNESGHALAVLNRAIDWAHSPAAEQTIRAAGRDSNERRSSINLREGRLLYTAGRLAESRNAFARFLPETASTSQRPALAVCAACGWDLAGVRAYLALIAAREGDRATADSAIQELERPNAMLAGGLALYMAAKIAAALGDHERALRILSEALRNPDHGDLLLFVHRERDWFPLRSYEPFRRLTSDRP